MTSPATSRLGSSLLLLWGLLAFAGCGGGEENAPSAAPGGASTSGGSKSSEPGTVIVDGSSTVFKISKAVQLAYRKVNPDVEVIVNSSGTTGGFKKYLDGEVDVIDASRAAKPEEEAKAKSQGIEWTRFLIGYDGIAVVVNKKNDFVKSLTVAQLKALYAPGSKAKTWKDLNPAWPDRKIVLYSPDANSGTHEFFAEAIVGAKSHSLDLQLSADDNILVRGVGGDADGLGYFGYAYAVENLDTLRIVPIQVDDKAPAVSPDPETILKKTYAPLSRPLYIYAKNSSMRKPAAGGFVKYYVENADTLVKQAKYVPPTAEDTLANKAALEGKPAEPKAETPKK